MNFSKKNHEHHKNSSSFVSKNLKTKITLVVAVFMLSIIGVNAQINLPKNNTIKNVELKNNKYKNLKLITGGKQGFVYEENNLGKKIPNAEIIFKSEDGKITKKANTDSNGRYKITLKPARYVVTIKYYGYTSYSTAPGFSVVNEKFSTFNIPLKKTKKDPFFIVSVFDSKTKKLKKLIRHKNIKKYKLSDPNSIFIYTTLKKQNRKSLMTLYLDKQFIIRNSSRINPSKTPTKTKPFVPNHKFITGWLFEFNKQIYKVLSSTKEEIKLLKVRQKI